MKIIKISQNKQLDELKLQLKLLYSKYTERFNLLTKEIKENDELLVDLQKRIDLIEKEIEKEISNVASTEKIESI